MLDHKPLFNVRGTLITANEKPATENGPAHCILQLMGAIYDKEDRLSAKLIDLKAPLPLFSLLKDLTGSTVTIPLTIGSFSNGGASQMYYRVPNTLTEKDIIVE